VHGYEYHKLLQWCGIIAKFDENAEMRKGRYTIMTFSGDKQTLCKDARMNFDSHRYVKIRTCFGSIMDSLYACLTVCAHAVEFKAQNVPLK
jgi:hypothetical protein